MKKEIIVDYIYFYYSTRFKSEALDIGNTTGNNILNLIKIFSLDYIIDLILK